MVVIPLRATRSCKQTLALTFKHPKLCSITFVFTGVCFHVFIWFIIDLQFLLFRK